MSLIALCVSVLSGGGYRIRSQPRRVGISIVSLLNGSLCAAVVLLGFALNTSAAENDQPLASPVQLQETNLQQLANATTQIQEQLVAMQRALEADRLAAKAMAAQNAEALSNGLLALEKALTAQQARELETWQASSQAMERTNRATLMVAGAVAGVGFLALLILTYFQWRTSNKLAEISAAWPMGHGLGFGSAAAVLGAGDLQPAVGEPAEQANSRLLGALEQLDSRIHELKRTISASGNGDRAADTDHTVAHEAGPTAPGSAPAQAVENGHLRALLDKANSMMNADNAEAALACFDEVLALAPQHPEALVKKGAILERMNKLNEAIECYDRAIAADSSMTFAYLHKGGLCSRLERFKEALECYEKALRTHEQHRS